MAAGKISAALSQNPCYWGRPRLKVDYDETNDWCSVGKVNLRPRGQGGFDHSIYQYVDRWPGLAKYKIPTRSHADEMTVLDNYVSSRRRPTDAEVALSPTANAALREAMPSCDPPVFMATGRVTVSAIIRALTVGGRDKSPGYPLSVDYRTKGEAFDEILPELIQAVAVRLMALELVAPSCVTPEQFYNCFCVDLMSFSIKNEVIKTTKDGRPLIAYSYVDAAVEYLWLAPYADAVKAEVYESYSAIGIGFDESNCAHFKAAVGPPPYFVSDVPGFDGGETEEELEEQVHNVIAKYDCANKYARVAVQHERAVASSMFIMSNGLVVKFYFKGCQKSGRFGTSTINTLVRAKRSFLVDLILLCWGRQPQELPICAGDDSVESPTEGREEAYAIVGYPLRDAEVTHKLEFCSFNWDGAPYGVRLDKAVFKAIATAPVTAEKFTGFVQSFRHHPQFWRAVAFISSIRDEMKDVFKSFQNTND